MASMTVGETADATAQVEGYEAFKVEHRGIELIPQEDRRMKPSDLFWLWAGAVWNVEFLVYGALIMSFYLAFWQAVVAILIGNVFFVLLGVASVQGPETGTTAFMVSRAPFGRNGNRPVSFFNWATQVGFEIEGLVLVVLLVAEMFRREGVNLTSGPKIGVIVVAVAIQFIAPFLGHATITKVLRYLSYVFILLFIVMAFLVIPHAASSSISQGAGWGDWTTALVVIVSAGGLGWTENGNDYSRYLPRATPKVKTFWAATLGGAIPAILLELLGAAAYLVTAKSSQLVGVPHAFDSWFFWPFAIFAIIQLFAINTMDLYSSGVTLQALGLRLHRIACVVIDTIVAGAITALVVLKGNFNTYLSGFLLYIVVWLAPWFGILITDWLLRGGRYDSASLASESGGLYWRNGGFNWKALIAQALGMFAAVMWTFGKYYQPSYVGPLSSHIGNGSDLSWVIGIVVGAGVYWALSFRSVREEALAPSVID